MVAPSLLSAALALAPVPAPDFDWLAGRWCGGNNGVRSEEIWTDGAHGTAVGLHRDLGEGGKVAFEFMRIEVRGRDATFFGQPGGRPATAFAAIRVEPRAIVFENAGHDYPKRIGYARTNDDTLEAWIDGGEGSDATRWSWRRCAADASD
jgi:hypothetical protein